MKFFKNYFKSMLSRKLFGDLQKTGSTCLKNCKVNRLSHKLYNSTVNLIYVKVNFNGVKTFLYENIHSHIFAKFRRQNTDA